MPEPEFRLSELGAEDRELLHYLVEQEHRRLSLETRRTFSRAFRDELHRRLERLERLLDRLREPVTP